MKIFIILKRKILITCIITLIMITIYIWHLIIKSPEVFTIELSCNSVISDEFKDKIRNLVNGKEKIAYLTFDDGPNTSVTPKILDILKAKNIRATFFVIGKYVFTK